jgi:hypothetical protein
VRNRIPLQAAGAAAVVQARERWATERQIVAIGGAANVIKILQFNNQIAKKKIIHPVDVHCDMNYYTTLSCRRIARWATLFRNPRRRGNVR